MKKLLLFKIKSKEEGFITLEVIISLLIALAFVGVSMQSLVYAMAIKVQAQEKQRANQLIQEDIERLNQLGSTALAAECNPVATTAPVRTAYQNGYAQALWAALPAGTQTKTLIRKIDTDDGSLDDSGKQLALRRFHVSGTTAGNNSAAPHRTLKVGYQVWDWDGSGYTASDGTAITDEDDPIAETYVEVIPDAALLCP